MQPSKTANSFQESFRLPLLGFMLLAVIFPITLLLRWPYPSADPLWVTSYDIENARSVTLDTASLPLFIKGLAWANHILPFLGLSVFVLQMARVSANFNIAAQFTQKSVRYFYQLRMFAAGWEITCCLVKTLLESQVDNYYQEFPHVAVNGAWAVWPVLIGLTLLLVAGFMEGALRRSLTLQEDVDTTI